MPASDCGRVQLGHPLAVLLHRHLAASAPDEADDPVGEVARRAQAVGARVLGHQQLGVADQLRPGGGRRADAGLGELVLAVPDAAHAAEPRHRVVVAADGVVGQVARDDARAARPGLDLAGDVGQRALRRLSPGVSVLPSSVMSGPPLPLVSALVQSVMRLPQGIQSTTTLVLLYCGYCLWNWATTPFIQVTWDPTDGPIRHTVSLAGCRRTRGRRLLPEPQPAAAAPASATAAPIAAADLVSFTARSPFPAGLVDPGRRLRSCPKPE